MIIGITGKAGSGKDTVAEILVNEFGLKAYAMSWPIKMMATGVFGFTVDEVYKDKEKINEFWGITAREFLQKVGTDLFRNQFRLDVWVRLGIKNILNICESNKGGLGVVVSDIRFDDEAKMIRDLGGKVWLIERHDNQLPEQFAEHESEKGVDQSLVDRKFENNSDINSLAIGIIEHMKKEIYSNFQIISRI